MEDFLDFGADPVLLLIDARRHLRHASFVPPPPGSRCAGTRCRANGHLMEPWAQGIPNPETAGFLNQNQECRLERVLPVVGVDKLGAADAQDHRAVALDQGLESQLSGLAPAGRKPREQLPVRELPDCPHVEERTQLPQDGSILPCLHGSGPRPS